MPAKARPDFDAVHTKLKTILQKYAKGSLKPSPDVPGNFVLIGPPTETSQGKDVWFGAVQTKKNYVSYHLMPVYAFPELLADTSPELKKRMQGKSCFNFTAVDDGLFKELAALTAKGHKAFKQAKLVK
ncbi:MAG: hypothetical protein ACT4QE_20750 [Anaerolineales bacterium]